MTVHVGEDCVFTDNEEYPLHYKVDSTLKNIPDIIIFSEWMHFKERKNDIADVRFKNNYHHIQIEGIDYINGKLYHHLNISDIVIIRRICE